MYGGASGDYPPLWYRCIRAAKYLGVTPWELQHAPYAWFCYAEAALAAEADAQRQADKRNKRRG